MRMIRDTLLHEVDTDFLPAMPLAAAATTATAQDRATPADTTIVIKPLKLVQVEPLYIDLILYLGEHKGEKEWNIGAGLTDNLGYDQYEFLEEYEWAPLDRLGLEIEVSVTMYSRNM